MIGRRRHVSRLCCGWFHVIRQARRAYFRFDSCSYNAASPCAEHTSAHHICSGVSVETEAKRGVHVVLGLDRFPPSVCPIPITTSWYRCWKSHGRRASSLEPMDMCLLPLLFVSPDVGSPSASASKCSQIALICLVLTWD